MMCAQMGPRDYISRLPDEILGKILSLLWTNRAACTRVLSKRWRNLFSLVDNLELSEEAGGNVEYFGDFVEKTLALLSNVNSPPIKRFSLIIAFNKEKDPCRVCSWIRTALELGCLELYLGNLGLDYIQPHFFFTSNTLVELTLNRWLTTKSHLTPGSMIFPALKKLSLISVVFPDHDTYHAFISAFPLLQDLLLSYSEQVLCPAWSWSGVLLNPSIKRLTIFNYLPNHKASHPAVRFDTPSLEYLDYTSCLADHYHFDLPSLLEARLDITPWDQPPNDNDCDSDHFASVESMSGLVKGISNVKTLHLSPDSLQAFRFARKPMPLFTNLLTLSFESHKESGWEVVPLLLNNSPNLHTLVIKGLVHEVTDGCGDACVCKKNLHQVSSCLSTCRAKVLKISGYRGTCRERNQMKHFLANLKCLETVKVKVELSRQENNIDAYASITNSLLKLPRASPTCQIHISDFLFSSFV